MRIACYCQHVLGIGHFHRSLDVCRALARDHEVQLIVGGPPVEITDQDIRLFQLPGLQMDSEFQNLAPCDAALTLAQVKEQRKEQLFSSFQSFKPEIFLVELYPFGRKAFRFELDPVLAAIKDGSLPPCRCYVSLRDILVERLDDQESFENRAVTTTNRYFDGLLVHADQETITLDQTFSRYSDITIPIAYTGFVTRSQKGTLSRAEMRKMLHLKDDDKLIVVSIGGGNVGGELLTSAVNGFRNLRDNPTYHMHLFTGPYCSQDLFEQLQQGLPSRAVIHRFADNFPDWLQAADLSISMAGYNTCMNIVQAGVPALVYPFNQNREQLFRATMLQKKTNMRILNEDDLHRDHLVPLIEEMSHSPRYSADINLDGAAGTRRQLERWNRQD